MLGCTCQIPQAFEYKFRFEFLMRFCRGTRSAMPRMEIIMPIQRHQIVGNANEKWENCEEKLFNALIHSILQLDWD